MSSPSRASKTSPGLFSEQLFGRASKMSRACFFDICELSARGERGGGRGAGWVAGTIPGLQIMAPKKGETTMQHVPKPRAGERIPGLAAGRLVGARSHRIADYFSRRPGEFRIGRPPFGGAFPGKPPGRRSSPTGTARGGRVGRAWTPSCPPSPFLGTPCLPGQRTPAFIDPRFI